MRASRRTAVLGAAVAAALSAAPAQAALRGLQPVGTVLRPAADGWADLPWTTDRRVCHVQVRIKGVDVSYPRGRGYTSFEGGGDLRPGYEGYTAFRVTGIDGDSEGERLVAVVQYDYCRRDSPVLEDAFGLWLPKRE